jgi:hypothetical protein
MRRHRGQTHLGLYAMLALCGGLLVGHELTAHAHPDSLSEVPLAQHAPGDEDIAEA